MALPGLWLTSLMRRSANPFGPGKNVFLYRSITEARDSHLFRESRASMISGKSNRLAGPQPGRQPRRGPMATIRPASCWLG